MFALANIFRWLIDTSAAGAALLLAAYAVMPLLKQPARRLRVAELALAACLVLAIVQAIPATRISLGLVEVGRPAVLPWFDDTAASTAAPTSELSVQHSTAPLLPAAPSHAPHPPRHLYAYAQYWREALLAVYAAGVLLMTLRLLVACFALRRLARGSQNPSPELAALWQNLTRHFSRPVRLAVAPNLNRPLTFGLRRPVVLLPSSLAQASHSDLLAVLRHELGHVERRDAAIWLLAALVNIILFFLPPLWLLKRHMRLAQEFLADRIAADSAASPVAYAEMMLRLVKLTQHSRASKLAAASLTVNGWLAPSDLMLRLRHLFNARHLLERRPSRRWTLAAAFCVLVFTAALGAMTLADNSVASQVRAHELHGVRFLLERQNSAGGWLTDLGPAPTALIVRSLLQAGVPADHPAIVRARGYVDSCQQSDGGYYTDGEPTYHTAVVLSMYAAFNDAAARSRIAAARLFLERELAPSKSAPSGWYNISANPESPPAITLTFADPRDRAADAILETYGSLTYARWKSLVYAGLTPTDPRVKQTSRWLAQHWTLDKHPGTDSAEGLYYYYLVAAKTLRATASDSLTDSAGHAHAWREEIQRRLLSMQSSDGNWVNAQSPRWLEDRPEMVTAYALLTLQETRK